jgi:HEPN domain-containing protein
MAEALLDKELYEGAIFHCYHAFEAICSAAIVNKGQQVPRQHRQKFNKFRALYPDLDFIQEFATLLAELYPKRERSLYADVEFGQVTDPTLAYSRQDAKDTLVRTRAMVTKIEALLI